MQDARPPLFFGFPKAIIPHRQPGESTDSPEYNIEVDLHRDISQCEYSRVVFVGEWSTEDGDDDGVASSYAKFQALGGREQETVLSKLRRKFCELVDEEPDGLSEGAELEVVFNGEPFTFLITDADTNYEDRWSSGDGEYGAIEVSDVSIT